MSSTIMTSVTDPTWTPWTRRASPESAKNIMNTKITSAVKMRAAHSGQGMIPSAPCSRSSLACSRSEVWSSHLAKAVSSLLVVGLVPWTVSNMSRPQWLMSSPWAPDSMRGHSVPTTYLP